MPDVPPVTSTRASREVERHAAHAQTFSHCFVSAERYIASASRSSPRADSGGAADARAVEHRAGEVGELGFVRTEVAALLADLRALPVGAVPALHPTRALDRAARRVVPVTVNSGWFAIAPVVEHRVERRRSCPTRSAAARGRATRPPSSGCGWPSAATTSSTSPSQMRNGRSQCEPVSITTPPPAAARSNRHGRSPP